MGTHIRHNINYTQGGDYFIPVTVTEYNSLPSTKLTDHIAYFVYNNTPPCIRLDDHAYFLCRDDAEAIDRDHLIKQLTYKEYLALSAGAKMEPVIYAITDKSVLFYKNKSYGAINLIEGKELYTNDMVSFVLDQAMINRNLENKMEELEDKFNNLDVQVTTKEHMLDIINSGSYVRGKYYVISN